MALIVANRVKENTSTTGVGGITFTGSLNGFQPFSGVMTNGDITYYVIEENDKWEVGIGTYGSNNMTRTTILTSSNGGNAISLGGSGVVSLTYPAEKATYLNENDEFVLGASGLLFTNGTVFKEAKLVELTDVLLSGTPTSSTIIDFNVTAKGLSIGDRVGAANSSSVIIGYGAASGTTSGYANVVVGAEAATNNQTGFKNVHVGNLSGPSDTSAATLVYNAVSVGYQAGSKMRHNTTAIGYLAGYDAYEIGFVAIGSEAGYGIGAYSVAVGNQALYTYSDDYAVGIGYQAAHGGGGGSAVWIGNAAGKSSTAAERSVGIGKSAGQSSTADDAIYIGNSAGKSNTSDDYLFIGNGSPSSSRTLIKGDMQSKRLAIGAADVTLADTLYVGIASSSDKGLVVKGASSQSADLTQWITSADAPVASISNSGVITANALFASGQGLELASATPITTANTLYNVGGDLYFNGGAVSSTVSTADLTYVSGIAVYASGQAASLNYASGLTATNATNITATTAVANYASGQATSLNYVSGVANYTSGVVTGGNPTFGNMYVDEYIYHNGDNDTYVRFQDDNINMFAGNKSMIKLEEAANDKVIINTGGNDIDFVVEGENDANLIRTDAANDLVGIGTSSPAYKLDVFGHDAWVQASGIAVGNSGVVLANNAPAVTTNTLYNDGGTLKFNGSAVGGGDVTTAQLEYVSGVAVYGSGQAQSLGYASGVAIYASGQATSLNYASGLTATNASNISTNTSNISTNTTNITSTTAVANYASGQATSLNYASGLTATNASNISTNTTNITATTSVANYASGQATSLNVASGVANYASGNTANISFGSNVEGDILYHNGTIFTRLAKGTDDYVLTMNGNVPNWEASSGGGGTSAEATYASGQAIENEADIVYVSGVANYASGMQLNGLTDVKFDGTNFSRSFLVNTPGSSPSHGTLNNAENNVGIGYQALSSITSADKNIAFGYYALKELTTGSSNIAIGFESQRHANDGFSNIAIGQYSLLGNSDGTSTTGNSYNIAIGDYTARDITTGDSNIALGTFAMDKVTTGSHNVGMGDYALQYVLDGSYNVAIGRNALQGSSSSTAQSYNTAVGVLAGYSLTTGDKNIFLGYTAGYAHTSDDSMLYIANNQESANGTLIKGDMANKYLAVGKADVTLSTDPATLQVYANAATDKVLLVQGHASQSDALTSWQTSAGDVVAAMTPSGVLNTYGVVASGAGVRLHQVTPTVTTDTLYNVGGSLYFDGSAVGGGSASAEATYASGQATSLNVASGVTTALLYTSGQMTWATGVLTGGNPTFGNAYVGEYIYHNGDDNTYIQFGTDQIDFVVGAANMIYLNEGGGGDQEDKVAINNSLADIDFQVKGANDANLFRTDALNDKVGIGTSTPSYKLDVFGHDAWVQASGVQVGASGVAMQDVDLSHTITIKAPDVVSTSYTLPLPSGIGTTGQVLTTDGAQTYWSTVSGGGGDIEGVTAGNGLSGGGTSGTVTLNVEAAQTVITSIYATDLIIGEDAQTAIDFGTVNEIDFKVDNANRLTLTSSSLYPETTNQIDLGTSSLEFKDAYFDGTVTSDAFAGPLTGDVTGNADTATALETARTINTVSFDGTANITVPAAGSTLTDTVTVAKGGTGQTSYTNGQLLIGNTTGNTLAKATLTAGSNVTITNGTGTISIAATDTNTTYSAATSSALGLMKLEDDTEQSVAANTVSATAGRTYGVQFNSSDQAVVNVPWTDTNTTYSVATSSALGLVKLEDDTEQSVAANAASATASRTYGIQLNSSDQAVVNVPWADTNTTYTAGDGLDLSGTEFSADLKSNGGLVIESTELAVDLGASSITGTLAAGDGGTGLTSISTLLNSNVTPTSLSLLIGTNTQAYDAQLDTLAALTADQVGGLVDLATLEAPASDGQFIVATGAGVFAYESGATARTSLGLGTAAVLDTGISDTNVAKFTSGVVDDDFLRVAGTAIEGRAASEVLTDIAASPVAGSSSIVTVGTITAGTWQGTAIASSYVATLNQNTTGTAAIATTVTITDNESTNENNAIIFTAGGDLDGGNLGLESDGDLHYNPSTGTVTATVFVGALTGNVTGNASGSSGSCTGNAATATALASARNINGVAFDGTGNITVTAAGSTLSDTVTVAKGGTGATSAADARTNLGLGTAAVLDTGISDTNVPKFTTSVADDDFLRVAGTAIEGRSASEVLSDISAVGGRGNGAAGNVAFWSDANTITDDPNQLYWDASNNRLGVGTSVPTSTLAVSGNLSFKPVTITDSAGQGDLNWTAANKQYAVSGVAAYYLCETGGTSRTINLPDPAVGIAGRTYSFKKIDSGIGTVTIQPYDDTGSAPAGGYIDGDNATADKGTNILFAQYDTISCTCAEGTTDGRFEWHIVQEKVAAHTARIDLVGAMTVASSATPSQVTFDTLKYATGAGTTITGGVRKVTINRNGKYSIKFQVSLSNTFDLAEACRIILYKNGVEHRWSSTFFSPATNQYLYGWLDTSLELEVDDYLQIYLRQESGETATVYNVAENGTYNYWDPFLIVEEIK